ncbi:MAG: ATP-dependent DNA helicase RecG [Oscillospiraceae bacterium]|nr:ATP-dependent DNA helicase RecG [Oscillospiraceae bacterium]MCL2279963.1 ATP-dependent DNA helicase RecG [Oscillospiraceae bacterium]
MSDYDHWQKIQNYAKLQPMKDQTLDTSIRYIKGVGEAREKLMGKLGMFTLRDLVGYFPRAYEDRTLFSKIADLQIGQTVCVQAMAAAQPKLSHIRKGLDIVKVRVVDESGSLEITFFNQAFIKDAIKQGESYIFYGRISGTLLRPEMTNPIFEVKQGDGGAASLLKQHPRPLASPTLTGRIMPIYPLTAKLSQKIISSAVRHGLNECGDELPDVLPGEITRHYELCKARYAYENIHFPEDFKALDIARRRLIFEELFVLVVAMRLMRERRVEQSGKRIKMPNFEHFYKNLHFTPTGAQKRAIIEATEDMSEGKPMNRLIQGDVGSGKTLVAAACAWNVWQAGLQVAFMAPTEILAKQHMNSLTKLLEPMGMRVGLLTGAMTAKAKREMYAKLSLGEIDLVIGTHALISEGVHFHDLGLVITDEQHRFGVAQRSLLTEKGDSPHVLVMSATPIPRTLALIIYGDLDVSTIDEMPPGRREIETHIVGEHHRKRVYGFIEKLVKQGRQVYIICPMVEEEEVKQGDGGAASLLKQHPRPLASPDEPSPCPLKSAKEFHKHLSTEIFPELSVKLVHGKMKPKEKDAAMNSFASGEADILVATTVVEVGVDVQNAALIIVENADRFGLSQLHQLRGRVGRGEYESHCILFNSGKSEASRERLEIMKSTNDGFKIAEKDLSMRGPGDFFGSRQHGLPELHIANFATDMLVLNQAQNAAADVLKKDPELKSPQNRDLADQIKRMFELNTDKMN